VFPEVVFKDLKELSNTISTLKGVLPTEAEIIQEEFVREINSMKEKPIEKAKGEDRYQEIPINEYVCRKYFIHGTERESKLTGADLAIEVEGQKLVFYQAKREEPSHRFEFDRRQMLHLLWLNDEIIQRNLHKYPQIPHVFSYKVPCFYKLIFIDFAAPQFSIKEERYVPVRHVEFILGRRKGASAKEFITGYLPSEFQEALKLCEAGSPDLVDENLKKKIFLEYSLMSNRLVAFLHIR
jgi:hypothetical protein